MNDCDFEIYTDPFLRVLVALPPYTYLGFAFFKLPPKCHTDGANPNMYLPGRIIASFVLEPCALARLYLRISNKDTP
jgi:hypothetical protein